MTRDEPPIKEPGMAEVVLDPQGRLVSFRAVPPRFEAREGPWPDADWPALLAETGLDPAALHPASPRWSAFVDSDKRAAWDGVYPGQPDVPMHIEAAAYRGRPVWFEVQAPWAQLAALSSSMELPSLVIASTVSLFIHVVGIAAGTVLVRRNLRLGRGDRRGAFRLAAFSLVTLALGQLSRADHTAAMTAEYGLLTLLLALSLYFAAWAWFLYMAMEPAVRRRWPHTLISWSRLLAGRFRDPLVGLFGGVAGEHYDRLPTAR